MIAEDGEICFRGRHVFKGYLKDEAATEAALDREGWLHSGDIGTIDKEGYVQITDRKKDLLITAGGENIAPQVIEGVLKSLPVVGQAVVLGDRQKFLAALLTLDVDRVAKEAEVCGSSARDAQSASVDPVFVAHIEKQVAAVNASLARVQTIKKFKILPNDFTIDGGELTPTMKIKRKVVNEKYKAEIEALYAERGGD
jgi:long-subunit acyl-CoA synthetase (AMP-forming)